MKNQTLEQPEIREDVVQALREMARRGARAPELVREVQSRLGYADRVVLPVLWYLIKAFCLNLNDVLPLREWIDTPKHAEMNALLMPLIEAARPQWETQPRETTSGVA